VNPIGIALVGCGYVADFYAATLSNPRELAPLGVWDRDPARLEAFTGHWRHRAYDSFAALLADPDVQIVVNLTNPASHYEVSAAALGAGKHVYTEKPLAMTLDEATKLVESAEERGLLLGSAPCSLLSEAAQTLWATLADGAIGTPRLVYAELDDGMIHRMPHDQWVNPSGAVWPAADEFQVGCTVEHSGYVLSWLTGFFGPVTELSAMAASLLPDKGVAGAAPDFSCGVLRFASGVLARLTNSIVAPRDHRLTIVGDEGVLDLDDILRYGLQPAIQRGRPHTLEEARIGYLDPPVPVPLVRPADYPHRYTDTHDMDVARGIADLARAVQHGGTPYLGARHALHVLEVTLALAGADREPGWRRIESTFPPPAPAPWQW
jgi:predicted dehydrogenase